MRSYWLVPLGVGLVILLGGCSSSTEGSDGGSAVAKCNALGDKVCKKLAPCQGTSVSDCVASYNASLKNNYGSDCSGADQVSSTYDACMSELDNLSCGDQLPADCHSVILFQK